MPFEGFEIDISTLASYVASIASPFVIPAFVVAALYFAFTALGSVMDSLGIFFVVSQGYSNDTYWRKEERLANKLRRRSGGDTFSDWEALQDDDIEEEGD